MRKRIRNWLGLRRVRSAHVRALDAQTQALIDLKREMERQNDFAVSLTKIESREAIRRLADLVSAQIGETYTKRSRGDSAGSGGLARF